MPYIIKKTKEKGKVGYKVCKRDEPERCFSKHPLSEKKAMKQRTAIILSELGKYKNIKRGGVSGDENTPESSPGTMPVLGPGPAPGEITPPANIEIPMPGAPMINRAQTDINQPRMATGAPRTLVYDSDSSEKSSSSPKSGPSIPKYTQEQCIQFLKNPKINPKTNRPIVLYGPTFDVSFKSCKNVLQMKDIIKILAFQNFKFKEEYLIKILGEKNYNKYLEFNLTLDEEDCKKFVKNQLKDPVTDKNVIYQSERYNMYYDKCKEDLSKDTFDKLQNEFVENEIKKDRQGARKCLRLINNTQIIRDINGQNNILSTVDPFNSSNKNEIDKNHPLIQLLLTKCDNRFHLKFITYRLMSYYTKQEYIYRLNYILRNNNYNEENENNEENEDNEDNENKEDKENNFRIEYENLLTDIREIAKFIIDYGDLQSVNKFKILIELQSTVKDIIDNSTSDLVISNGGSKIYIVENVRQQLQSCLFEIEALKKGIVLELSEESSSSSSGKNSSEKRKKRNKSITIPEGLPILPKKTREEILKELETTCRDMKDSITLDEFKDMKKKKLQLIVKIGPADEPGEKPRLKSCYYVKSIFDVVKSKLDQKLPVEDPETRYPITNQDMINIILPKMRYIKLNVINPFTRQHEQKIPNVIISEEPGYDRSGRPFHKLNYQRTLANVTVTDNGFGYIPSNIYINENDRGNIPPHNTDVYTGSTDLSSAVIIAKLSELDSRNLLIDMYGHIRVDIDKPISYWNDTPANIIEKAKIMIDEFNRLLH